jgi:hypothetical protein
MNFFNSDMANHIQYVSFVLELIGLPLIIVELYFKNLTIIIEDNIESTPKSI